MTYTLDVIRTVIFDSLLDIRHLGRVGLFIAVNVCQCQYDERFDGRSGDSQTAGHTVMSTLVSLIAWSTKAVVLQLAEYSLRRVVICESSFWSAGTSVRDVRMDILGCRE